MNTIMQTTQKKLHQKNQHNHGYDFDDLVKSHPALKPFITKNPSGQQTIRFADPLAVKTLNAALLAHHYQIKAWDIPAGYLCPPIPGRVDYLHYIADLLGHRKQVKLLDVGTGANGVYALLAASRFDWQVVATDIDQTALDNVGSVLSANPSISTAVELRLQTKPTQVFKGIIQPDEQFDVTVCNPPFHESLLAAQQSNREKVNNLAKSKNQGRNNYKTEFNFGGSNHELWCEGGELQFLNTMMLESQQYAEQCGWFTTLVSKNTLLPDAKKQLRSLKAKRIKVIEMQQGNKTTRILAWSYRRSGNHR